MSKRMSDGRFAKRRSPLITGLSWIGSVGSVCLPYIIARVLMADLAAFRSCNANASGLRVVSCGKHSLNFGDFIFLTLFILSIALVISLFTISWRMSRRIAV